MNTKIKDSLYGFIIGDAIGVPIEFVKRSFLEQNPLTEMIGYKTHNVKEGTWSDDTSMTLATIDSIIENNNINYEDIMQKFSEWFLHAKYTSNNSVFDIGNTTIQSINKYLHLNIEPICCGGNQEYDNGNGSLMRIMPIAFYLNSLCLEEDEEIEIINNISSLTHAHEISKLGCSIYIQIMKNLINGFDKQTSYINACNFNYEKYYSTNSINKYSRILNGKLDEVDKNEIESTGYIVHTLESCIWSLLTTNSFETSIINSINLGNDTDTIGAITGSMTGILYGYSNMPSRWIEKLEKKEYINDFIDKFNISLKNISHNKIKLK